MLFLDYWKSIKDYEDKYSGSYCGGVRSWDRVINTYGRRRYLKKGRILKPSLDKDGYLQLNLYKNGVVSTKKTHRLIAETFISNPNNYPQINHNITPTKTINCVPNLEWATSSQNKKHAYKNCLIKNRGEHGPNSKLTEKQVIQIKARLFQGQRSVDLAKKYGVNPTTISMIKTGRNWGHV